MRWAARCTTLRIARRTALRHPGRSLLVMAMVGTPVLGLTAAGVLARTAQLPRSEVTRRDMGEADLRIQRVSDGPVWQTGPDGWGSDDRAYAPVPTPEPADVRAALPPGSRATPWTEGRVRLRTPDGIAIAGVRELDVADPMTRGVVRLRSGRWPRDGGEVLLSPALRDVLGARVGGTVTVLKAARPYRVAGIAVAPGELREEVLFAHPDERLARLASEDLGEVPGTVWLVDLPAGVSDLETMAGLNANGWYVRPRSWMLRPLPVQGGGHDADAIGIGVVVVGLATLEVCLLAGTAFAVGARRQRRELAVLSATGADRSHVRAVVLGGGIVLGGAGGVAGAGLGVALAVAGRPLAERLTGGLLGPLDVRPLEVAGIAAVGLATGLLSAMLPARGAARQDVVAGLTGRRGQRRVSPRVPILGLAMVLAGAALAFYGAGSAAEAGEAGSASGPSGVEVTEGGRRANFLLVLAGAALTQIGLVVCAPAAIALLARLSRRMPLSLRFATRDAARHRGRSGPAVAAVTAALAGCVTTAVYAASDDARQRRDYEPGLGHGQVYLQAEPRPPRAGMAPAGEAGGDDEALVAAVAAELPTRAVVPVREVAALPSSCTGAAPCPDYSVEAAPEHRCPLTDIAPPISEADFARHRRDPRCSRPDRVSLGVADAAGLRAVLGRTDPAAERALARGAMVVFDEEYVAGGRASIRTTTYRASRSTVTRQAVPAVAVARAGAVLQQRALISPATAAALGLPVRQQGMLIDTTRMPTAREEQRARAVVERAGFPTYLQVERGYRTQLGLVLLALLAGSGLVTVLATGIATGLAAADSRPDLATLGAVGASPRLRRTIATAQAATVSVVGMALGLVAGLVPAIALVSARPDFPLAIPWTALLAAVVVVPLLASAPAGILTRSRFAIDRRAER